MRSHSIFPSTHPSTPSLKRNPLRINLKHLPQQPNPFFLTPKSKQTLTEKNQKCISPPTQPPSSPSLQQQPSHPWQPQSQPARATSPTPLTSLPAQTNSPLAQARAAASNVAPTQSSVKSAPRGSWALASAVPMAWKPPLIGKLLPTRIESSKETIDVGAFEALLPFSSWLIRLQC